MTILVTGSASFIGSNFVLDWLQNLMSLLLTAKEALPIYGDGLQIRDWLYV